jgi:hypothetical protein
MDAKKVARAVLVEDLAVRIIGVRAAMAIADETHARLGIALDHARKKHRRPKPFMARLIQMHTRAGAEAAFLSARHEVLSHNLKLYETMSV